MSIAPPPTSELTKDFFNELSPRLSGELYTDEMTRALYATDASMYQIQPVGVLVPRTEGDVQAALEVASKYSVPVLPRGGGSSLAGQTVGAALVMDFSRHFDGLLELNAEEQWARVQPGLVLDLLNTAAAEHDLMVGPDPASSSRATLGGMLANNATGTHSILYGNMIHHVREARGFLPDGTPFHFKPLDEAGWEERKRGSSTEGHIYRRIDALLKQEGDVIRSQTPKHWRRSSGYRPEYLLDTEQPNMAKLLCGSEGTLAVVTELTVDLVRRPETTGLGIVHFDTRDAALRAVSTILDTDPSAVELFDGVAIERTRETAGYAHRLDFIEGDPGSVLITEYYGRSRGEIENKLDGLQQTLDTAGESTGIIRVLDEHRVKNVWSIRKEGLGLIMGVKNDYKPWAFIEDASVPVENLPAYIDELSRFIEETDTRAVYYAHASAGTLHVRPFINTKKASELEKMRDIALESADLVAKYGGSVSSEHGDGLVRGWLNERFLGTDLYEVYRDIKNIFDPDNLLNPGKVVNTPDAMTRDLRMGPDYETIPVIEELDWSEDGGFARSVERCNGNGACRKLESGTMCPSFMVTREEEDSTRGRANALRNALSGAIDPEELTSERMCEVMDLCVQCKACKTECPSNVDMAKMKTEWLGRYWAANGVPLRVRLFANLPRLTRAISGSMLASIANWFNRRRPLRKLMEWTLGISAKRPLPEFARKPFTSWYQKQRWEQDGPPVVLFADTFNNYNHPETARAAAEFFRAIGREVVVPDPGACCGRPLLSKGYVNKAQIQALKTVEALYPYAEREWPIVGLEPSCMSVFTDDLMGMLPGDLRAEKVALACTTFEEYVADLAEGGVLDDVEWTGDVRRVLLHGHCHQKALTGTGSAEECLALPPGYTVETVDSGCCGMAGAFGYEEEHYDISLDMAERRLSPAVRGMPDSAIIAAPGVSCRSQIQDTTGRTALHPAEVLRDALADRPS